MRPEMLLDVLKQIGKLKTEKRHCFTEEGRKESVADHTFRLALMAMLLREEPDFQDFDMNKVLRMCLIHDLGESFTGDMAFEKSEADEKKEDRRSEGLQGIGPAGPDRSGGGKIRVEFHCPLWYNIKT